MKKLLAIAAAALLLWSCAPKSNSSKGVVLDASMNTVMVVSGSDTLTFVFRDCTNPLSILNLLSESCLQPIPKYIFCDM